jgi:hypothetical protein
MYDLTVAGTRNFNLYNGIAARHFHFTGTGVGWLQVYHASAICSTARPTRRRPS